MFKVAFFAKICFIAFERPHFLHGFIIAFSSFIITFWIFNSTTVVFTNMFINRYYEWKDLFYSHKLHCAKQCLNFLCVHGRNLNFYGLVSVLFYIEIHWNSLNWTTIVFSSSDFMTEGCEGVNMPWEGKNNYVFS